MEKMSSSKSTNLTISPALLIKLIIPISEGIIKKTPLLRFIVIQKTLQLDILNFFKYT